MSFALFSCGGGGGSSSDSPVDPAPSNPADVASLNTAGWRSNMINFGLQNCDAQKISSLGLWEGNVWYYDGVRVYYQIADYTGDSRFLECAQRVRDLYASYVIPNRGRIPGWRVFPQGMAIHFRRTGESSSRQAVSDLANNSVFANVGGGESFELSRETAYLINAYITESQLGGATNPLLGQSVNFAQGHLRQWLTTAPYVKPFMVALTAEALIGYASSSGDNSVLSDLPAMVRWLRQNAWSEERQAFQYIVCRDRNSSSECSSSEAVPQVDLNLLIVPMFGYVALTSGDKELAAFADKVFNAGVSGAFLSGGKQFSQSYRWSFDYLRWRGQMR